MLLNSDLNIKPELDALFLPAFKTRFGCTDKEIDSLLKYFRLRSEIDDPANPLLKSYKSLEQEFKSGTDSTITEYTVCKKCHSLYPPLNKHNVSFFSFFLILIR